MMVALEDAASYGPKTRLVLGRFHRARDAERLVDAAEGFSTDWE
jgi:hypothetical protein